MKTKMLSTKQEDIQIAANIIRQGGTVIFPTETVYGLGANALDEAAVRAIYKAKGRPADNPLIVHIAEVEQLQQLVADISEQARVLIEQFWPGPLTLIFPKQPEVPDVVTGGLDTIAVRMPKTEAAHELIRLSGVPIAAPSANLSGKPSPTVARHVADDMFGRVDAIIDGGDCQVGVESTVLDMTGSVPVILRPGGITPEQIRKAVGEVQLADKLKKGEVPRSPGMKYKHYAPQAQVVVLSGELNEVQKYAEHLNQSKRVGLLVFDEFPRIFADIPTISLGSSTNAAQVARNLFRSLREMDELGVDVILAPEIPHTDAWLAVRNRLYRAAGETVIQLPLQDSEGEVTKVLFVCTGNTCRSPMATGIFNHMAQESNRKLVGISAGLCAQGGPASSNAIAVMDEIGIDIRSHTSRQLSESILKTADLVLTMSESHRQTIFQDFPVYVSKIHTLGEFAGANESVADPYGGNMDTYRRCRDQIHQLMGKVIKKLI